MRREEIGVKGVEKEKKEESKMRSIVRHLTVQSDKEHCNCIDKNRGQEEYQEAHLKKGLRMLMCVSGCITPIRVTSRKADLVAGHKGTRELDVGGAVAAEKKEEEEEEVW